MKRAEHSSLLHLPKKVPPHPPEDPVAKDPHDARDDAKESDPEKLKENRKDLGVDKDHRTEGMKKGRRGTFP